MDHGARAEQFRDVLIRGGVASGDDIIGCSPVEIAVIEAHYGPLPDSYRAVLALMGHRAGNLIRYGEFWIYARQLDAVNRAGRECVTDYAEDGIVLDVPSDAFFICVRYGGDYPHFLRTGRAEDSPVWAINSDIGKVAICCASVWDWVEGFLVDHPAARALLPSARA